MSRIAIIGSGISGLAAAYYLSRQHDISVFERDTRLGGHTNTIVVDSSIGPLPVDTGFIVHNEKTYPNFCKLMRELNVETQPSDMSFAVTSNDFEYSSRGLGGFFAQQENWLKPSHYLLLKEILRFNREAPKLLNPDITLREFLDEGGYDERFIERYLYPMACAVWSMSPEEMNRFPALTLIRFFQNHGMLGINTHPKWRTIKGGSHAYIDPLTKPFSKGIHLGANIGTVVRHREGVRLEFRDRPPLEFDHVVFACHGDQVLPLLNHPTPNEHEVFSKFQTSRNEACLHTDERMLPRRPAARASWNYLLNGQRSVQLTYDMNRLQSLPVKENYCVSLNANGSVAHNRVIQRMIYHHPLYTHAAVQAQSRWNEVSGIERTHYCGAYWFNGFHEDGVRSALRVAQTLGVTL